MKNKKPEKNQGSHCQNRIRQPLAGRPISYGQKRVEMSCLGIQNRRWRRTETLHCRAPCSPHLGTLLMTARGLAGRRRASCGIGSEARAPTRRSGPRIASDRVSRAHPTRSCNHRADTSCDKISQLPTHCPHLHSLRPPTHRRCRTHSRRPPRAP